MVSKRNGRKAASSLSPKNVTSKSLKLRSHFGKIRTVFGEFDPQLLRFWLFVKSSKACVQIISKSEPYKIGSIRPLTSDLTSLPSKMNSLVRLTWRACEGWIQLVKKGRRCYLMDSYIWTHQCWLTCKNLHSPPLWRHWMLSRGRERENQRNPCCPHTLMIMTILLLLVYQLSAFHCVLNCLSIRASEVNIQRLSRSS